MKRLFAVVALLLFFAAPLAQAMDREVPPNRSYSTIPPADVLD